MAKNILTNEDKAGKKIADIISDLRLDSNLVGESLGTSQPVDILNRLVTMVNGMYVSRERLRRALGETPSEIDTYPPLDAPDETTDNVFTKRCELISDFYLECKDEERFKEIFRQCDIGLPGAYLISNGFATANEKLVNCVNETWFMILYALFIDSDKYDADYFDNLEEMLTFES